MSSAPIDSNRTYKHMRKNSINSIQFVVNEMNDQMLLHNTPVYRMNQRIIIFKQE